MALECIPPAPEEWDQNRQEADAVPETHRGNQGALTPPSQCQSAQGLLRHQEAHVPSQGPQRTAHYRLAGETQGREVTKGEEEAILSPSLPGDQTLLRATFTVHSGPRPGLSPGSLSAPPLLGLISQGHLQPSQATEKPDIGHTALPKEGGRASDVPSGGDREEATTGKATSEDRARAHLQHGPRGSQLTTEPQRARAVEGGRWGLPGCPVPP